MEKPETTEQVDVSGEATELQMATLEGIESAITHDAIQGETIEEHHASEIEYLRNLLVRAEAGGLDSNPADSLRLRRFKKQQRDIVEDLKRGIPNFIDMKGPRHAEQVRAYFEGHGLQKQLLDVITTYKSQILRHTRAAEMVKEADVPQREDEVVAYLKSLGLALSLKAGETDPKVVAKDILLEFQRAKIDQDIDVMRDLAHRVGIPRSAAGTSIQDAAFWAHEFGEALTDKPDKSNEKRRDWFKTAGIPVHAPTVRPAVVPSSVSTTTAPAATAVMDRGDNLLAPIPKKGADKRPQAVSAVLITDELDTRRRDAIRLITKFDHMSAARHRDRISLFHEGTQHLQNLMVRMGNAMYPHLQHTKARLARLINPERNARWAKMRRQVFGHYLDAHAENWGEIKHKFKIRVEDPNYDGFRKLNRHPEYKLLQDMQENPELRERMKPDFSSKILDAVLAKRGADQMHGVRFTEAGGGAAFSSFLTKIQQRNKSLKRQAPDVRRTNMAREKLDRITVLDNLDMLYDTNGHITQEHGVEGDRNDALRRSGIIFDKELTSISMTPDGHQFLMDIGTLSGLIRMPRQTRRVICTQTSIANVPIGNGR